MTAKEAAEQIRFWGAVLHWCGAAFIILSLAGTAVGLMQVLNN